MIYFVSSTADIARLKDYFPCELITHLMDSFITSDAITDPQREIDKKGGYSILLDSAADMSALYTIINVSDCICEYACRLDDTGYMYVVFVPNNDFSVVLYLPISTAPDILLKELED